MADYGPGAWTAEHFHGGLIFVTILEGELTLRERGVETRVKAGETFVEPARPPRGRRVGRADRRLATGRGWPRSA